MNTTIEVGPGKAHTVYIRDGIREVVEWDLDGQSVPAVHTLRATLVRHPVDYYRHASYSPEVMAARSENIARLGWNQESFNLPKPPEIVGTYNLLSLAVASTYQEINHGVTSVEWMHPAGMRIKSNAPWHPSFSIYLNIPAYEFYHLLFAAAWARYSHLQFSVEPIDVSTAPKLARWLTRFEAMKKRQYREHGFDWNPKRGPITAEQGGRS